MNSKKVLLKLMDTVCCLKQLLVTQFLKQCVQYLVMPLHLQLSGHVTSGTDHRIHLAKILSKFIQLYVEVS